MFTLLTEFGIKPWEINATGEVMYEDIKAIMTLRQFKEEGRSAQIKKEQKKQEIQQRFGSKK